MKTRKLSLLIFTTTVVISACKKPDDIKPTFTVESPVDSAAYTRGSAMSFKAVFKDNEDLSQYKIDIHDDIDNHGHNKTDSTVTWSEMLIGDLTGQEQTVTRSISIPVDAKTGPYHFLVKCTDAAGNEASFKTIGIKIN